MSDSLRPHGPQPSRLPCPSLFPRVYLSVESVMPFNQLVLCCPLLLLPSIFPSNKVFFPMSRLFASDGQSIGTLALASVLAVNTLGWFSLGFISNSTYYNLSLSYMFTVCFNSFPLDNKFHKGGKVSVFFFTMSSEPGFQKPIFI